MKEEETIIGISQDKGVPYTNKQERKATVLLSHEKRQLHSVIQQ